MHEKNCSGGDCSKSHMGVKVGVGLATAAAGAAVAYYLFGTEQGKSRRKDIGRFAHRMKDRASESATDISNVTKDIYSDMSHLFKGNYAELKKLTSEEMSAVSKEIRNRWQEASGDIQAIIDKALE